MKNTLKFFVLIAVFGLLLTTCDNTNGGEDDKTCTHTWNWETTTEPTEFKDGEKTETCSKCEETRGKESVLATGMVQIPAGTFIMGPDFWNPDEDRKNDTFTATLSTFKMSKYEITQDQYQEVMGNNPSYFNGEEGEIQGKRPVEQVNWYDTIIFCNKLSIKEGFNPAYSIEGKTDPVQWGDVPTSSSHKNYVKWSEVIIVEGSNGYRLPTDAQWEYACRAGSITDYYFGDDVTKLGEYAWYSVNSNNMTHEVGKKKPNAYGLYDMHGNVWEWCWDWWGDYPTEAKTDYTGAVAGTIRLDRGGSWSVPSDNLVSAGRGYGAPVVTRYYDLGFRVVRP